MRRNKPVVTRSVAARLRQPLWLMLSALALAAGVAAVRPAAAQDAAEVAILPAPQLEELVGPIALYPDDLVAIVLPASTYPLQIVEAARFLDARTGNANLKPDADWDDSVVALLNYPEVVRLLNDDLDWTWDLGTAVLNQRADVLDAVQGFRDRAYTAGNLRSDERQVVTEDDGAIAIAPADPEVIYVPYYEPRRVVVYQTAPVFHYYPWGYPVYYYPYPAGYVFQTGFFWGVTSAFSIGWHTHYLHVHHYGYADHPYFGWNYYDPFYVRNDIHINVNVNRGGDIWQPRHRYGGRPIVRGQEGRVVDRTGGAPRGVNRGVDGSTYRDSARDGAGNSRSRTGDASSRAPTASRTRPDSAGSDAPLANRTRPDSAARQAPTANRSRPDTSGAVRTVPNGSDRASRGAAQSNELARTRPTGAPEQRSRTAPSPRLQNPGAASPRVARPAAPSESARIYRSAPPQGQAAARSAAPPSVPRSGNSAPARSTYSGGGMSGAARESRGAEMRSAPRAAAPRAETPSASRMSAAPRGEGGGSYRGGGSAERSQPQEGARGGEGRSRQR